MEEGAVLISWGGSNSKRKTKIEKGSESKKRLMTGIEKHVCGGGVMWGVCGRVGGGHRQRRHIRRRQGVTEAFFTVTGEFKNTLPKDE